MVKKWWSKGEKVERGGQKGWSKRGWSTGGMVIKGVVKRGGQKGWSKGGGQKGGGQKGGQKGMVKRGGVKRGWSKRVGGQWRGVKESVLRVGARNLRAPVQNQIVAHTDSNSEATAAVAGGRVAKSRSGQRPRDQSGGAVRGPKAGSWRSGQRRGILSGRGQSTPTAPEKSGHPPPPAHGEKNAAAAAARDARPAPG